MLQLASRFPIELDWGVAGYRVVPFRLGQPFAGLGDLWKIPVNRDVELDMPPCWYKHEFHPTEYARTNHDQAEAQLKAVLGEGAKGDAVNVYERHWKLGFFTVRVTTWPRELNSRGHNVFAGKNPFLWISANVTIEPELPYIERMEPLPMRILIQDPALVCQSQMYARRCRGTHPHAAGLAGDLFVVTGGERTMRVPLSEIVRLIHTRLTPGRYSGSSTLALQGRYLDRHPVNVTVANGAATGSLDHMARDLATGLGKPLAVEEYSDDG